MRPTRRLVRHSAGLSKRRRADGLDDGSAQTPRRRAGQWNRDEAMDALLVVEKYLTNLSTGLHACITLFITKDTLLTVYISKFISHEQKCNVLCHADSIQSRQKLS